MRKKRLLFFIVCILLCFSSVQVTDAKDKEKTQETQEKQEKKKKKDKKTGSVELTEKTSQTPNSVTLCWKKVKKVNGYEIWRKQGKNGKLKLVKKIKKNTITKWTDKKLNREKEYYYKIRTYKTKNDQNEYGAFSKVYLKKSKKLSTIKKYTYVPYVSGGRTPKGWDCSGFTQWALKEYFGVDIPKTAATQAAVGKKISKSNKSKWKPGDVLVYSNGSRICHVALYLGDGKLMHALCEKYGTIIQDVDYYERWDSGTYLVDVRRHH